MPGLTRDAIDRKSEELISLLQTKLGPQIIESGLSLGDAVILIKRENLFEFFKLLKLDAELQFNMLVDLTVVDWLDAREDRFELVYHLLSIPKLFRLRIKVGVPEESPEVESITGLWKGANYMEREAWDMYGVKFAGHPDLRRILMYDEFEGHPLRKDYPVQGKQPRIPFRHPEVRNTALDMVRPPLVGINPRRKTTEATGR